MTDSPVIKRVVGVTVGLWILALDDAQPNGDLGRRRAEGGTFAACSLG